VGVTFYMLGRSDIVRTLDFRGKMRVLKGVSDLEVSNVFVCCHAITLPQIKQKQTINKKRPVEPFKCSVVPRTMVSKLKGLYGLPRGSERHLKTRDVPILEILLQKKFRAGFWFGGLVCAEALTLPFGVSALLKRGPGVCTGPSLPFCAALVRPGRE
jgi:hypothetical protein